MEVKNYENLKFYNYIPVNKELKKLCVACPSTEEYEAKLDKELEDQLKDAFTGNILDRVNPKYINADLKRELGKKLNILSRKTNKAIIELIKRKININKNPESDHNADHDEDDENTSMTLNFDKNFDKNNDKKLGYILHQTLNKLDDMDESD